MLASIGSVPWHGIGAAAISWGVLGVVGAIYVVIVARRMRVQQAYSPQFEDWLFHVVLPFAGYGTLIGSAYAARSEGGGTLFAVGAAALLLLFVGIHNAWDAVTYHVLVSRGGHRRGERREWRLSGPMWLIYFRVARHPGGIMRSPPVSAFGVERKFRISGSACGLQSYSAM